MTTRRFALSFVVVLAAALLMVQAARAEWLWWGRNVLETDSIQEGYELAEHALRQEKARQIRKSPDEVTGQIGETYVAITCVATTPRVTVIVMAMGPDSKETTRVRERVRKRVTGLHKAQ
jgi:hypothetical protein